MKKITFFAVIGLLSTSIYASHNPKMTSSLLQNSVNKGGFYIGGSWMYLLPSETNNGMDIGSLQYTDGTSNLVRFKPDYQSGYSITLGYDIPCTENDIFLNYEHLDEKINDSEGFNSSSTSFASYIFSNLVIPGPLFGTVLNNTNHLHYHYDKVDLAVGHHFNNLGDFSFHPSIGLRYALIKHEFDTVMSGTSDVPAPGTPFSFSGTRDSRFEGIGPLVGVDAQFDLYDGMGGLIGLVGHFYSALIIGNIDSDLNLDQLSGTTVTPSRFTTSSIRRVVTSFDGKLGLNYTYDFCNQSKLTLEAGYQASKYYDAIDLIRGDIVSPFSEGGSQRISQTHTDDFDLNGPYIYLTYHF